MAFFGVLLKSRVNGDICYDHLTWEAIRLENYWMLEIRWYLIEVENERVLTGLASKESISESDWPAIDFEVLNLNSTSAETFEDMLLVNELSWSLIEDSCELVLISLLSWISGLDDQIYSLDGDNELF